jgi:hypothetical protein
VTRLDRVVQQLRSFAELHANELDLLAAQIETTDPEAAGRLRAFQQMQRDEAQLVIDEITDIRAEMSAAASKSEQEQLKVLNFEDPAVDSPKRARWLAEQAARDEQLRRPRSRRHLLGGVPRPPSSIPPGPAPEA